MCALINRESLRKRPLLCYVTDRRSLALVQASGSVGALLRKIQAVIAAGVDWVQIREKDLPSKELAYFTRQALKSAAKHSGTECIQILVNDRLDVALAEHAGGAHLGENSVGMGEAMRLLSSAGARRSDFLIGVSCHSLANAVAAAQSGADYVFFGPVFDTPSKAGFGAPQGLARLAEVCGKVSIPVIAIGGISLENAGSCVVAGAAGVAAIRLFQDTADPRERVWALHEMLARGSSEAANR